MAAGRRGGGVTPPETEPPTGLPEDGEEEDLPLGIPSEDDEPDRELPGFPERDIDTAG
ncbi:MAG TPA: hypothetical protein VNT54_18710 [Solirubrobacteraceae bacterium]|nr:hypothetical protein [Solirubrobacteraceae bacterium]